MPIATTPYQESITEASQSSPTAAADTATVKRRFSLFGLGGIWHATILSKYEFAEGKPKGKLVVSAFIVDRIARTFGCVQRCGVLSSPLYETPDLVVTSTTFTTSQPRTVTSWAYIRATKSIVPAGFRLSR